MGILLSHLFTVLGFLLGLLLISRLLKSHRSPGSTMAWLLAILLIPYIGVPLYFLIGGRKIKRLSSLKEVYPAAEEPPKLQSDTERILFDGGAAPSRDGNRTRLLASGEDAYKTLLDLIENAQSSLSIATFIIGRDPVGEAILEALCRKARQGIKVRFLVDGLGSFGRCGKFLRPLREAGGQVGVFLPILPSKRKWSANLRNHRKIWIADERVAIIGGRNLAQEYLGPDPSIPNWADLNVEVEGPVVTDLVRVFASDWTFATDEKISLQANRPAEKGSEKLQCVSTGPDAPNDPLYQGVLTAILSAKERVWIVTPYFIPDESIVQALSLSAKLGRDIRIIVPAISNHRVADFARGSYIRQLRLSGVKFFAYQTGMMHTKLILVDQNTGVVGSANMDLRSLYLNYEVAAFIYTPASLHDLDRYALNLLAQSEPLGSGEGWRAGTRVWLEDVSRLLAPLL